MAKKAVVSKEKKLKTKNNEYDPKREYQKYLRSSWFKKVREIVLDRDNHRCLTCGATSEQRVLNCHHSQYEGVLGNELEHLDKMVTLCSCCHNAIHKVPQNYRRFSFAGVDLNNEKFKKAMQT